MTEDLIIKYGRLLAEFSPTEFGQQERKGLLSFLSRNDMTDEGIAKLVNEFRTGLERQKLYASYFEDPVFHWIIYIEAFERKGSIKSPLTRQEVVERVKKYRGQILSEHHGSIR
jgi:hypothetical protein